MTVNLPRMSSGQSRATKKWHSKGRWALVLALIGVLIISFVAVTGGQHGAWLLWIAIPILMISLGYLFLVNALPIFLNSVTDRQPEQEDDQESREG